MLCIHFNFYGSFIVISMIKLCNLIIIITILIFRVFKIIDNHQSVIISVTTVRVIINIQ